MEGVGEVWGQSHATDEKPSCVPGAAHRRRFMHLIEDRYVKRVYVGHLEEGIIYCTLGLLSKC